MDGLAGRQLRPHSLSDVMHLASAIFSHTGTLSYVSVSTPGLLISCKTHREDERCNQKEHKVAAPEYSKSISPMFFIGPDM